MVTVTVSTVRPSTDGFGYEGYQKQVQGILTVGEEGEIVIEPKMKEWLESI